MTSKLFFLYRLILGKNNILVFISFILSRKLVISHRLWLRQVKTEAFKCIHCTRTKPAQKLLLQYNCPIYILAIHLMLRANRSGTSKVSQRPCYRFRYLTLAKPSVSLLSTGGCDIDLMLGHSMLCP
jgi:hypothetical protein